MAAGSASSGGGLVGMAAKTKMDARAVKAAARAATIRTLPRAGSYIRGIARRSIRRRQKPSSPGSPPHTRTGNIKRAIRYDLGPARESVAIGPARENAGRIWQTLEYGGRVPYSPLSTAGVAVGGYGTIRKGRGKKRGRIRISTPAQAARALQLLAEENARRRAASLGRIAPRPFMRPALVTAAPAMPQLWRNTIRSR